MAAATSFARNRLNSTARFCPSSENPNNICSCILQRKQWASKNRCKYQRATEMLPGYTASGRCST